MLKIFKRKKAAAHPLQDKAAGWVVAKILWLQHQWSNFMDRKINRLSIRSKRFGLMVFVGLSLLVCTSIVIETFTTPHTASLHIGNMRKQIIQHADERPYISPGEYNRVVSFHRYMDSLAGSASGKKIFDSIMRFRPGLLDSARLLEQLFNHQNK